MVFFRAAATVLVWMAGDCVAQDWPCFRGPSHNGVSSETDWQSVWPDQGPPVAWRFNVGIGYASVAVSGSRLYTMGNVENIDTVYCLEARTGKLLWKHSYPCPTDANEFQGGPTSTPTIRDGRVYTLSRTGDLFSFEAITGKVHWKVNVPDLTSIRIPGWGFSGSPWVNDNTVVVNVGDAGVGLSIKDGTVRWASADKDAGYSSFVPFNQGGVERLVFGSARSYVCIDPQTGAEQWRQRWLTTFGCNATDPVMVDGRVFLSTGYNRGSGLLDLSGGNPQLVWKHKELQTQLATSVLCEGKLYGANGSVAEGATLTCIDPRNGEVLWNARELKVGGLMAAGNRLITMTDDGVLRVVEPGISGPGIKSEFRVFRESCWTMPVLCQGRIYCRGAEGALVCVDVTGSR